MAFRGVRSAYCGGDRRRIYQGVRGVGDWRWRARKLADQLVAGGAIMDPAWGEAFAATPRHVFVPRFFDGDQEITDDAGDRWLDAVYADAALLTTRLPAAGYDGTLPTSSSSRPRIMAIMLDRLDVRPGMRVLEIGTGTGYNTAVLCHRLGDGGVATVDLDPDLINSAVVRLGMLGYHPTVVAADGAEGLPATAPYDRILATCAITHIPPEWIRQLTDGGRIVAPFAGGAGALAVLTKTAPDEVTGRIDSEPALSCRSALVSRIPLDRANRSLTLCMSWLTTARPRSRPQCSPRLDRISSSGSNCTGRGCASEQPTKTALSCTQPMPWRRSPQFPSTAAGRSPSADRAVSGTRSRPQLPPGSCWTCQNARGLVFPPSKIAIC